MKGKLGRARWLMPLLLSCVVYLSLSLSLALTKAPWCDEGWFANPAYNLAVHGNLGSNVLEPAGFYLNTYFRGVQQRTYYVMPTHLVALAAWFRVFGMGAFSARMYSICWGGIAIPILFYIAQLLFPDRRVAILGTLLTAVDFIFLWSTADTRMEAPASTLALCSLAAYLYLRKDRLPKAVFWSSAFGACAVFVHPNAALVVLATMVVACRYDWDRLRLGWWRHLGLAAAPYMFLGILWSIYIAQSPHDFAVQFFANAAGFHSQRFRRLIEPGASIGMEIDRHLAAYFASGMWSGVMKDWMVFIPLLYIPAIFWFLLKGRKQQSSTRIFLTYGSALVLGMTFLNGFKTGYYLVYVVPLYDLVFGAWLLSLWERKTLAKTLAVVFGAAFIALQLSISILHIRADEYHRDYEPTIHDLERDSTGGKSIVGTAAIGLGMGFHNFKDDVRLGLYSGLDPDVIILDRSYRRVISNLENDEPPVFDHIVTMLSTHYRFAAQHGSFWIFERVQPAEHATPWIDVQKVETIQKTQRAAYFFRLIFDTCKMHDLEESTL